MTYHPRRSPVPCRVVALCALVLTLVVPATAAAQSNRPSKTKPAMGENYRVEITTSWWGPGPEGSVTSDRLSLIGSRVDLVTDFGLESARFKDIRIVLRAAKKHRLRFQYTPLTYSADSVLTRDISFGGQVFPVSLPVKTSLSWKVWRFGYEWDFLYKSRGFVGVLFEGRATELSAEIESVAATGSVSAHAPIPSIGIVARAYPLPDLALNFEFGGMKLPSNKSRLEGTTTELDLSATVNITNSLGISAGWRRTNTDLRVTNDRGTLKFEGLWFGGAVRF